MILSNFLSQLFCIALLYSSVRMAYLVSFSANWIVFCCSLSIFPILSFNPSGSISGSLFVYETYFIVLQFNDSITRHVVNLANTFAPPSTLLHFFAPESDFLGYLIVIIFIRYLSIPVNASYILFTKDLHHLI